LYSYSEEEQEEEGGFVVPDGYLSDGDGVDFGEDDLVLAAEDQAADGAGAAAAALGGSSAAAAAAAGGVPGVDEARVRRDRARAQLMQWMDRARWGLSLPLPAAGVRLVLHGPYGCHQIEPRFVMVK
jgi:hypothetical protein